MRNARGKLEIPMLAAVPCKTPANCRGETCSGIGKRKIKYDRIVDTDEFMRIPLEGVPHRSHEDHIAAQGINSLSHDIFVLKFIPMPQAFFRKKDTRMRMGNSIPHHHQGHIAGKGEHSLQHYNLVH